MPQTGRGRPFAAAPAAAGWTVSKTPVSATRPDYRSDDPELQGQKPVSKSKSKPADRVGFGMLVAGDASHNSLPFGFGRHSA